MMRIEKDADYKSTNRFNREKVFRGYGFDILNACYPTSTSVYATAVDELTGMAHLVFYDFNNETLGPQLWKLRNNWVAD